MSTLSRRNLLSGGALAFAGGGAAALLPARRAAAAPATIRITDGGPGTAGAICAGLGFGFDLEHVGWATGAALLVMRPAPRLQQARSIGRVVDVIVGAAVAIALVTLGAPDWAYSVAVLVAVVCVTATAGSRWYVMPAFTTFLVFVMLLVDSPGDAHSRFWERVLETALGVAVAALVGLLVPALLARRAGTGVRLSGRP